MPEIFEVFGFPFRDTSDASQTERLNAHCPFMGGPCDGGGNREQTNIDLSTSSERLKHAFPGRARIPSGVCSIMHSEPSPWIVCPRRLLVLGRPGSSRAHQEGLERYVLALAGYSVNSEVGVWNEVSIKEKTPDGKSFDYKFDYVLMQLRGVPIAEAAKASNTTEGLLKSGPYVIDERSKTIQGFPVGAPTVVEIMTSSTSGSNQAKGTTIPQAFEAAFFREEHTAPGINKRQIWSRMASQLLVKSEVAAAWGGTALWILQDNLVDYIRTSTALDMSVFDTDTPDMVNVISVSLGTPSDSVQGIQELQTIRLHAGPIGGGGSSAADFSQIVRAPFTPDLSSLMNRLARRAPDEILRTNDRHEVVTSE